MPVMEIAASTGTAAFAARGGRASSNSGTGSPSRVWSGPNGQSPRPLMSAVPSSDSHAMLAASRRSCRPVIAERQISPSATRLTIAHAACASRNARAATASPPNPLRPVHVRRRIRVSHATASVVDKPVRSPCPVRGQAPGHRRGRDDQPEQEAGRVQEAELPDDGQLDADPDHLRAADGEGQERVPAGTCAGPSQPRPGTRCRTGRPAPTRG